MSVFILIFFIFLLLTIFISKRIYKHFVNPISIFQGIFLISLITMYSVNFIDKELSFLTWSLLIISFLSFDLGVLLYFTKKKDISLKSDISKLLPDYCYRFILPLFLIVVISTFVYYFHIYKTIGLSYYFSNILFLSEEEVANESMITSLFLYLKKINIILAVLSFDYLLTKKRKYISMIIIIIFSIFVTIASRRDATISLLFMLFLTAYFRLLYNKKSQFNLKKILLIIILLVFMTQFFSLTQVLLNKQNSYNASFLGVKISDSLATILLYISGTFKSTSIYLENPPSAPFLGTSLRYLYHALHLLNFNIDIGYTGVGFVNIPLRFNTAIAQYYIYIEGGILWTAILYSIFGYYSTKFFFMFKRKNDSITLLTTVLIFTGLFLSIRSYIFMYMEFVVSAILLIVLYTACKKKRGYL